MSVNGVCPDMDSLEWKLLVEEIGDRNIAFQVYEQFDPTTGKPQYSYPPDISANADMQRNSGMPISTVIDERVIDRKRRMQSAQSIINKKIEELRNRPNFLRKILRRLWRWRGCQMN